MANMKFEQHKSKPQSQWKREGKVEWKDNLTLIVPKYWAWDLAHQILYQLQNDEEEVLLQMVGELSEDKDG